LPFAQAAPACAPPSWPGEVGERPSDRPSDSSLNRPASTCRPTPSVRRCCRGQSLAATRLALRPSVEVDAAAGRGPWPARPSPVRVARHGIRASASENKGGSRRRAEVGLRRERGPTRPRHRRVDPQLDAASFARGPAPDRLGRGLAGAPPPPPPPPPPRCCCNAAAPFLQAVPSPRRGVRAQSRPVETRWAANSGHLVRIRPGRSSPCRRPTRRDIVGPRCSRAGARTIDASWAWAKGVAKRR
jgi:hypothetical protein